MRIFRPNIKKFKKEKDISSLIKSLYDKDYEIRDAAARALGEIGDLYSVKELTFALKDKNRSMSMSAAKALAMIGQPAIESLLSCLHDEDRNVRIAGLKALGIIGDKKTADQIAILLKDEDIMVESEAAKSLLKIGDERGKNALKEREKEIIKMKDCLFCQSQIEDHYTSCPNCGNTSFMQIGKKFGGYPDALSMINAIEKARTRRNKEDSKSHFLKHDRAQSREQENELSNAGTTLRNIDERFDGLLKAGRVDYAQRAISLGDGRKIYHELSQCYGQLQELICLSGPFQAKCILVFNDGIGLLAGANSAIPILTFGYKGQGSESMSNFLAAAGFAYADASEYQPPLIVRRNGTTEKGIVQGDMIFWETGGSTAIPTFPGN
jgi:hypothetical protein